MSRPKRPPETAFSLLMRGHPAPSAPIVTVSLEQQGVVRVTGPCSATMRKPPPARLRRGGPWLTPKMMEERQRARRAKGWTRNCPNRATRIIDGRAYCDEHGPG